MIHLRSVELIAFPERLNGLFPFNVPALRTMGRLEFSAPVTFLVGENGSGKSTLLEGLALAIGSISAGSEALDRDHTVDQVRQLAKYLRLSWHKRTRKGFFLRAEDFFGYARRLAQMEAGLRRDLAEVDEDYQGRSEYAKSLAKMPYQGQLHDLQTRYGDGLDSKSHGESFLLMFQQRFVPGGVYLLDEPEAPLSPLRQLSLMAMMKEMVRQEAQFIVATHSPMIMAFPGAAIWNFDSGQIAPAKYEELEHVQLTRDFLNHPGVFLRRLGEDVHEG